MTQFVEETGSSVETNTVHIYRTSTTVKGGRRFSFGALVVAGDRAGRIGYAYAKGTEVPQAIEKAEKHARRTMLKFPMVGGTIPHEVEGTFSASKVRLIPASPGTGIVAGGTVRSILEVAGVTDCLTKCYGSTNKLNIVKATLAGLERLRQREAVAGARGVEIESTAIEQKIDQGKRFQPFAKGEKMRGPVNTIGQERRGRGGGGGGRGGRGGPRGGGGGGGAGGGSGGGGGPRDAAPEGAAPAGDAAKA